MENFPNDRIDDGVLVQLWLRGGGSLAVWMTGDGAREFLDRLRASPAGATTGANLWMGQAYYINHEAVAAANVIVDEVCLDIIRSSERAGHRTFLDKKRAHAQSVRQNELELASRDLDHREWQLKLREVTKALEREEAKAGVGFAPAKE